MSLLNQQRSLLAEFRDKAKSMGLNIFAVTEPLEGSVGASIYSANGLHGGAVRSARASHVEWEKTRGIDPKHDWSDLGPYGTQKVTRP